MVDSPGELNLVCDSCSTEQMMEVTEYCGHPPTFGVDDSTLSEYGWVEKDGEQLCPDCKGEQ